MFAILFTPDTDYELSGSQMMMIWALGRRNLAQLYGAQSWRADPCYMLNGKRRYDPRCLPSRHATGAISGKTRPSERRKLKPSSRAIYVFLATPGRTGKCDG